MNYIVIDMEYNQNFDFAIGAKAPSNPFLPLEIIQIGAVKVDARLDIVAKYSSCVCPRVYPRLNPFVAKVTGLSNKTLQKSPYFAQAFAELANFVGRGKSVLCFWGKDDMKELFRNILYFKQKPKLLPRKYINVQSLASVHLNLPAKQQLNLASVVNFLEIEATLPFHDAPNDAFYTAQIFKRIYNEEKPNMLYFDLGQLIQHNKKLETGAAYDGDK